ncbi:GntR family transcriptional regulator [Lactobacillus sp. YT155]|uniref:GntR family transcriptional regulator n=1 Tax=Lactobacillus sp. YT155 TaxID=3060955 RepID=UPI00265DFFD1|nr:GntR family transcriptional regulator [Lactobacillus sp. YT155]MDO1605633.1 GntR family transcriptional regulator [Lactobacillus sp. YT155]
MNSPYEAPLYIQIENLLAQKITTNEFLPGEKISSERQLAETYGVNRMTVKRAIDALVKRGFLIRKQGSGTFVQSKNLGDKFYFDLAFNDENTNAGMTKLLSQTGIKLTNKVLGSEVFLTTSFFQQKLNLNVTDKIFGLHRLRLNDSSPFAIEYNYLPYDLFIDAEDINFKQVGLYDYMGSCNHQPTQIFQNVQAIPALEREANLLEVDTGTVLYYVQYSSTDSSGRIVEYTESYLDPSKVHMQYTIDLNADK